ncbi:hypothetical protein [Bosea lathyri]|uniref:Uncharacterized protein n=1 Tax=Bosea lathyri TaxID=1036778 RepID=A0A1H5XI31_9HYPH|nr:hypothetical protein [Bosea lathyri]SEG10896.1 hypothetical protein SAMN04488115_103239 [Bosea lathyri]
MFPQDASVMPTCEELGGDVMVPVPSANCTGQSNALSAGRQREAGCGHKQDRNERQATQRQCGSREEAVHPLYAKARPLSAAVDDKRRDCGDGCGGDGKSMPVPDGGPTEKRLQSVDDKEVRGPDHRAQ